MPLLGAGAGVDAGVRAFFGTGSDGPIIGGEVNYGIGFSGSVTANFTDTTVKMLGHL
jgi:hypothetical protein